MSGSSRFLLREVLAKKRVYCWTKNYLNRMRAMADIYSNLVEIEEFPSPQQVEGFHGAALGVAYVKETANGAQSEHN